MAHPVLTYGTVSSPVVNSHDQLVGSGQNSPGWFLGFFLSTLKTGSAMYLTPFSQKPMILKALPPRATPPLHRSGSKYKKLKAKKEAEEALPKYEPFLVPSINFPDKLFCALTNQLLTQNLDAVKQHLKGKRFQKAKGQCLMAGQRFLM